MVLDRLPESVCFAGSWDYVASLFVIGDAVGADVWKRLDAALAAILEQRPGLVLGAVNPCSSWAGGQIGCSVCAGPYGDTGGALGGGSGKSLESSGPELAALLTRLKAEGRSFGFGIPKTSGFSLRTFNLQPKPLQPIVL